MSPPVRSDAGRKLTAEAWRAVVDKPAPHVQGNPFTQMMNDVKSMNSSPFRNMTEIPVDPNWTPVRKSIARLLFSQWFDVILGIIIVFHLGLMVRETDIHARGDKTEWWMEAMHYTILTVYVLEIFLRAFVVRCAFFRSMINLMDITIVLIDVIIGIPAGFMGGSSMPSLSVIRVLRLLRLLRAFRVLSEFRELQMIISGFIGAMKALGCAALLIAVVLLIWSIIAVEILRPLNDKIVADGNYDRCDFCKNAFNSVWLSMLTYFKHVIAGDSWGEVSVPLIKRYPASAVLFVSVVIVMQLGILNLVLSVIVNQAQEAHRQEEIARTDREFQIARVGLAKIFEEMDSDGSGCLTQSELLNGLDTNQEFSSLLRYMNITRDDVQLTFKMLDFDDSGAVAFEEFVDGLYKMKTESSHTLLMFIRHYVTDVRMKTKNDLKRIREPIMAKLEAMDRQIQRMTEVMLCQYREPTNRLSASGSFSWFREPKESALASEIPIAGQMTIDNEATSDASSGDMLPMESLTSTARVSFDGVGYGLKKASTVNGFTSPDSEDTHSIPRVRALCFTDDSEMRCSPRTASDLTKSLESLRRQIDQDFSAVVRAISRQFEDELSEITALYQSRLWSLFDHEELSDGPAAIKHLANSARPRRGAAAPPFVPSQSPSK